MNLYNISISETNSFNIPAKSKQQAVHKAASHYTWQCWEVYFGPGVMSNLLELLFIDCIRNTTNHIKCLGNIHNGRKLAKLKRKYRVGKPYRIDIDYSKPVPWLSSGACIMHPITHKIEVVRGDL